MSRFLTLAFLFLFTACSIQELPTEVSKTKPPQDFSTDDVTPVKGLSVEEMNEIAQEEYDYVEFTFKKSVQELKEKVKLTDDKEEQVRLLTEENPAPFYAKQFMVIAKKYPGTENARNSVLYATSIAKGAQKDEAMKFLIENYSEKVDLVKMAESFKEEVPSPTIEGWYQAIVSKAAEGEDKAKAMYHYAKYIGQLPFFKNTLKYNPATAARIAPAQLAYINAERTDEQRKELCDLLQTLIDDYGDIKHRGSTLGVAAASELFEVQKLQVGMMAPDITGKDLDGVEFRLSDYEGKVVMLDFWGHWCPPCRAMYDQERDIASALADKPFVLIGVNSDRKLKTAKQAVQSETLSWRHFWVGEKGMNGQLAKDWNVEAWPTVYLIDHEGVIRYKHVHGAEIDAGLQVLMTEMGHEVQLTSDP